MHNRRVNAGQQVLDFLYAQQLQVDDEWAVKRPNGFIWWPAENAQTVEVIGEETSPEGAAGYLVSIRTEMVSGVGLTESALAELNSGAMQFASMSGPVYDPATETVSLCSLAWVHEEIAASMGMLLSTAAVLQLAEAHIFGAALAEGHGGHLAISGHPDRGVREHPDEMIHAAARVFSPANREPLHLQVSDFEAAVARFMASPPSVGASAGGLGLTVEFPYGDVSSLCQFFGEQDHPLWGNGLLIGQRFPYQAPTEEAGIRLALEFNRADLTENPAGYGLGSYVYRDDMMCFTGFIPNLLLRDGVLQSMYYSCATRALSMSVRLAGEGWDEDSFSMDHSAIWRDLQQ